MHFSRFLKWAAAVLAVAAGLTAAPAPARADTFTLQQLIDGAQITVGDKVFSNWGVIIVDGSKPMDFSQIMVTSFVVSPTVVGLRYETSGQWSVSGDEFISMEIGFQADTVSGQPLIKDNTLEMTLASLHRENAEQDPTISIDEFVISTEQEGLAHKRVFFSFGGSDFFDSAEFPPQSRIFPILSLGLHADGGAAGLFEFEETFSQLENIPEPATLTLFGLGLVSLGGYRCRRWLTRLAG